MGAAIYSLCAATAACCAWLLLRAFRASGARLLMCSSVCFALFAINNVLVILDLLVFPAVDLFVVRNATVLLGISAMLYGLIWNEK
jgi:hypothetical protein